jgi:hypothetical protein
LRRPRTVESCPHYVTIVPFHLGDQPQLYAVKGT